MSESLPSVRREKVGFATVRIWLSYEIYKRLIIHETRYVIRWRGELL